MNQPYRVSKMAEGPNWQHQHYSSREEAELAALANARSGFFSVICTIDDIGHATYLCEYAAEKGGAA